MDPTVASKILDVVYTSVLKTATKTLADKLNKFSEAIKTSYSPHLERTLNRCKNVKTILHGDQPVSLLSLYVNLKFSLEKKEVDDFEFIEELNKAFSRAVISGTAGSGKTIFMKYLFISLYERPQGKIPIFLELRSLNKSEVRDILKYSYYSIFHAPKSFSFEEFLEVAEEGGFHFLLDGFDEVNFDIRDEVELMILTNAERFPKCNFIVSSRPDDCFGAWEEFKVLRTKPLDRGQIISLVEKLEYDSDAKKEFLSDLKKEVFGQYDSLLSSPLMVTMMFLAHQTGAKIPRKIHLFYELVFHALYERHDGIKQSFKRKKYCDVSIDVFSDIFSTLCYISYREEKLEFTQEELTRFARASIEYLSAGLNSEDFKKDLIESVCMLQKDGLSISFVHRSFQEYFAARFVDRVHTDSLDEFTQFAIKRPNDNAIKLLFGMNQRLLETKWIYPKLQQLEKFLLPLDCETHFFEVMELLWGSISVLMIGDSPKFSLNHTSTWAGFVHAVSVLYDFRKSEDLKPHHALDDELFSAFSSKERMRQRGIPETQGSLAISRVVGANSKSRPKESIVLTKEDGSWLLHSGVGRYICNRRESLLALATETSERVKSLRTGPHLKSV